MVESIRNPNSVPMFVKAAALACAVSMTTWVMLIVNVLAMG
jgi:hypothetical protein